MKCYNPGTGGFTRRKKMNATGGFTLRTAMLAALILFFIPVYTLAQQNYLITPDVVYGHKAGMALTYDVIQPVDSSNGAGIIHVVSGSWISRYFPPRFSY
jgi:hypothetical protein